MKDTLILFDLDGTLWDSAEKVAESWNIIFAREDPTLPPVTTEDVHRVMGLTMREIQDALQPALAESRRDEVFRIANEFEVEYLYDHCGMLYPRLRETLEELRSAGYSLAIVSNCQCGYINAFLASSGVGDLILDWEEWGRTLKSKAENIRLVMERNHFKKGIYVGDTLRDQESAQGAGIPFIHAAYGFGRAVNPEGVIDRLSDLPAAVRTLDKEEAKGFIRGGNPYMPLWEHVPDGEPRVFTYLGETRVYVYGSHDTEKTQYCGRDYVVWSAPVTDLTDWTCHGVCYRAADDSILFAPDVVQKGDTWYLYAAERQGSVIRVARSDTPWGPFEHPVKTELGFDPGVLVDDDGRVYAYWGFCGSYAAELEEDMATIRKGTLREHPLGHCEAPWAREDGHADRKDAFFEASSPRKIFGKYVYIYSKRYNDPVPALGIYEDCNGFLSYKWSDSPLDGFREGGDISFNGGEILPDGPGKGIMTYRWGNNHGSVMEINGQWYVFYHRQTGRDEYSRQAMLEPIDAALGRDGKVWLGKIRYEAGEPVACGPVEMTSQGPQINGLDARKWISAAYACHLYQPSGKIRPWIARVDERREDVSAPVMDLSDGATVGFRYLQFGPNSPRSVTVVLRAQAPLTLTLRTDSREGKAVASARITPEQQEITIPLTSGIIGKRAVYFAFASETAGPVASFDRFTFD